MRRAGRRVTTSGVLIGEIYLPIERLVQLLRRRRLDGAHLPFNFQLDHAAVGRAHASPPLIERVRGARCRRGGWPNWVLGNHDQPRIASRVGRGAGARRGDAAAHAARHADALLRRRARHARRADPARARPGSVRARTCPASAAAATPSARRCSGAPAENAGFTQRASRGCRSPRTTRAQTWRASATTRTRCCRCTAADRAAPSRAGAERGQLHPGADHRHDPRLRPRARRPALPDRPQPGPRTGHDRARQPRGERADRLRHLHDARGDAGGASSRACWTARRRRCTSCGAAVRTANVSRAGARGTSWRPCDRGPTARRCAGRRAAWAVRRGRRPAGSPSGSPGPAPASRPACRAGT